MEPETTFDETAPDILMARANLHFRLLGGLYVLLVLAALSYPWLSRRWHKDHPEPIATDPGIANVNGESVSTTEFLAGLRALAGSQTLNHILLSKEILQEARKQNVTVEDGEVLPILETKRGKEDPAVRAFLEDDIRARLALRKLLLKNVTEETKRHIFETFKVQLVQYELFEMELPAQTAHVVEAALNKGVSFSDLAVHRSQDDRYRSSGGRVGFLTRPSIERAFGVKNATALLRLKPGRLFALTTPREILLVKIGTVRSSYGDLKSSVENILVQAGSLALLSQLNLEAKVNSPYAVSSAPPAPAEPLGPLPGNHPVVQPLAPLPGNAEVKDTPAPGSCGPAATETAAPPPRDEPVKEAPGSGSNPVLW